MGFSWGSWGSGDDASFDWTFDKDFDTKIKLDIYKDIDVHVDIDNNVADAEAGATASGWNTLAETVTYSDATAPEMSVEVTDYYIPYTDIVWKSVTELSIEQGSSTAGSASISVAEFGGPA